MPNKMTQKLEEYQVPITIGTLIIVALFLVTSSYSYAKNEQNTVNTINESIDRVTRLENEYDKLAAKQEVTDKNYVEIKTKLSGIEALMLDVRSDLKTHLNQK